GANVPSTAARNGGCSCADATDAATTSAMPANRAGHRVMDSPLELTAERKCRCNYSNQRMPNKPNAEANGSGECSVLMQKLDASSCTDHRKFQCRAPVL